MNAARGRLRGRLIALGVTGSIAAYKAVELLRLLAAEGADVVVLLSPSATRFVGPLIFAGDAFYDIFAYRDVDGNRFGPFAPFHPLLETRAFVEVGSVGSCLVMKGEVARKCRVDDASGLVGFCADARRNGFRIWVGSDRTVRHP